MAESQYSYHWLDVYNSVIGPETFHEYSTSAVLPAGHTLRRILLAQPMIFFKRGSVSSDDQQMYFLEYQVTYGNAEGAPVLYRSMRSFRETLVVDPTGVTNVYYSHHFGAALELGMNERVQRGGFYSGAIPLVCSFSIVSSGDGSEFLNGQANMPFRALYSKLITP